MNEYYPVVNKLENRYVMNTLHNGLSNKEKKLYEVDLDFLLRCYGNMNHIHQSKQLRRDYHPTSYYNVLTRLIKKN